MRRWLLLFTLLVASPMFATVHYVSFSSGSNSNPGTSASPWKSVPGMQASSSCGGTTPSYTFVAGDITYFKLGDTWPAACFQWTVSQSGSSGNPILFSTTPSFGSGSYATFNLAQTVPTGGPGGNHVIYLGSSSYVTISGIEIENQAISQNCAAGVCDAISAAGSTVGSDIVQYCYIHGFMTNATISSSWTPDYSAGGIYANVHMLHTTIDDTAGFGKNASGNTVTGGALGGGCQNCAEVAYSKFVGTMAACFAGGNCHDNEMTGISQAPWDNCTTGSPPGYGGGSGCSPNLGAQRPHTQIIEDENGNQPYYIAYNNYVHDNPSAGSTILLRVDTKIYNNVLRNNANNNIRYVACGSPACTQTGYTVNNIIDGSQNNAACIYNPPGNGAMSATLVMQNNLCISNNSASAEFCTNVSGCGSVSTLTSCPSCNYVMSTTEANNYGFTNTTKYYPFNVNDANVKGAGINLTSYCSSLGQPALCQDAEGAPWFNASYVTRPTSAAWDIGAYALSGGSGTQQFSCNISSITAWPSSANQPINIASAHVVATCSNPGTQTTTINSMVLSGSNPSDFTFTTAPSGGTCGGSLAAGGTCTVSFVFTPSAVGNRTATWTATTSATPSTTTISLSGVGSYYVQQCANYQNPPITSLSCTWPANQIGKMEVCWLYLYDTSGVTFNTPTDGVNTFMAANAPITLVGDGIIQAFNAFSIGNGTAPTITATLSSSSSHHGGISCGEYVSFNGLDTTVFATGTSTSPNSTNLTTATSGEQLVAMELNPSATATPGAGYTQRTDPNILFEDQVAGAAGSYNATASLSASDTWIIQLIALRSSSPLVSLSPSSLNYGNQLTHTTSAVQYALLNSLGTAPLNVTNITATGQFSLSGLGSGGSNCPGTSFTLPVGNTCNIGVVFSPSSTGAAVGTLSVSDNATPSPQTVSLSGTGIAPVISWSPTSYAFGNVTQGQTLSSSNIVLSNTGTGSLNVSLSITGSNPTDFSVASSSCLSTLGAGNSCNVVAQCNPQSTGSFSANLTETDSVQSISGNVALTCTGLPLTLPVFAPSPVFNW